MEMIDFAVAHEYFTAGNCECNIVSKQTAYSYFYKIKIVGKGPNYKIYLSETNTYIGYYDNVNNIAIPYDEYIRYTYYWKCISYCLTHTPLELMYKVNIYNICRCARCGRVLRDEQSVHTGIGPTCRRKLNENKNYYK